MPGISVSKISVNQQGGEQSWESYWASQDLNLWIKSRSGSALVDEFGNNSTLLPAVCDITNTNQRINPTNTVTINAGYVEVHALIPSPSVSFLLNDISNYNFIALIDATTIRVRCEKSVKDFIIPSVSTTELTRFKVIFRQDSGETKVRVYVNDIESSTEEYNFGAGKDFANINAIGNCICKLAYVNINNGTNDVLTYHLTGLGLLRVYDSSGNGNHGRHINLPSTTYLAGGSTYLMDNDFTIYEHPDEVSDMYIPDSHGVTSPAYQIKETFSGNSTMYNLAPALIQMQGELWDRSNTIIWNNEARTGYYDDTDANTKKRWHSSEFNQTTFKSWLQDDYKEIVFVKFNDNTVSTGRMLSEIMAFDTVRVGNVLTKTYQYLDYGYAVSDLTATFDVPTISAQLSWTDILGGSASYEIWASINGSDKIYVAETAIGATSYDDDTCKQGAWVKYYIRPKIGSNTYAFSPSTILSTPLCFKTDQSVLTQVLFQTCHIATGHSVTINWGDSTTTVLSAGSNSNITHDYATTGQYDIWLTGQLRGITQLEFYDQSHLTGDITNWCIPYNVIQYHIINNGFTGDITDHINWISPNLLVFDYQGLQVTGDLTGWRWHTLNVYDIHFENTLVTGDITNMTFRIASTTSRSAKLLFGNTALSGDISEWDIFDGCKWIWMIGGNFTVDLSKFIMPDTMTSVGLNSSTIHTNTLIGDVSGIIFPSNDVGYNFSFEASYGDLTGDMSSVSLPALTKNAVIDMSHNKITKLPRGNFRWFRFFDFSYNLCNSTELDSFLDYLDNYFTGGVVPLVDAVYILNGTGMGIPSAAGLTSRTSIINKYIAEGKTCTITVNS